MALDPQKLKAMKDFLKGIDPAAVYHGEVDDINGDKTYVQFHENGIPYLRRVFPTERLESIGAAFPTAQIRYELYSIGPYNISVMVYEGKAELEPFEELSEEGLKELERPEWRQNR